MTDKQRKFLRRIPATFRYAYQCNNQRGVVRGVRVAAENIWQLWRYYGRS